MQRVVPSERMNATAILPDILGPGLKVVICGTAVGDTSAKLRVYYANPTNQFWEVLFRARLTSARLKPQEYRQLPKHCIGLTDLVKVHSGTDEEIQEAEFDVAGLKARIKQFKPKVLAFNGKRAARAYFGRKAVKYGQQDERLGETVIFVLPSTSGSARKYWDQRFWEELATFVEREKR